MSYEIRDNNGFHQHREVVDGKPIEPWRYMVLSFGEKDCAVLLSSGESVRVPIDGLNRIYVNGLWLSPEKWDH